MFGTIQSIMLTVTYVIVTVLAAVMTFTPPIKASGIMFLLLWVMFAMLIVYDTDCVVSGGCVAWSWVRTVLYMLLPMITSVILMVVIFMRKDKDKDENNNNNNNNNTVSNSLNAWL